MKSTPRLECPSKDNKYYNSNINPFVSAGYGMFQMGGNCTCYAFGRWYELLDKYPSGLPTSNAENWYNDEVGYQKGSTPKLGAIICWRKGKIHYGEDGAGHVAVVEEIYADNSILVSESGAHNFLFRTRKICPPYLMSGYQLEGFIYNPNEYDESISNRKIAEDGIWGQETTRKAQKVFGTTIDGIISNQYKMYASKNPGLSSTTFEWVSNPKYGSNLIRAIQAKVGSRVDGFIGNDTIKCMQKWLGTIQDGYVSKPSNMVKAFQKWLNEVD